METRFNTKKLVLIILIVVVVIIDAFVLMYMFYSKNQKESVQTISNETGENLYAGETEDAIQNEGESVVVKREYESPEPAALFNMQEYLGELEDILFYSSDVDNMGNRYPYMFYCSNYQCEDEPKSVTYVLDGNYSKLEFTLGLRAQEKDEEAHGWLEFYDADANHKIFETTHFTAGVKPEEYSVDLTGIQTLKIVIGSDSSPWSIDDSIFLMTSEFVLY